jgi:hypothetical protein
MSAPLASISAGQILVIVVAAILIFALLVSLLALLPGPRERRRRRQLERAAERDEPEAEDLSARATWPSWWPSEHGRGRGGAPGPGT